MEFRLGNLCKNPPFSLPLTGAPSFASLPTLRIESMLLVSVEKSVA